MNQPNHSASLGKPRDYWFDNAKAVLILLVVIAHLAEDLVTYTAFPGGDPKWLTTLYRSIYIFHMPAFLVVSGRFARKRVDSNDWPAMINKLVVPYLLLQTLMMFWQTFIGYSAVSKFSYLSPLFGLWYLFTIAIYQLVTPHLKNVKWLFPISMVLAVAIQFGDSVPTGGLMRVVTYYPFFLFGYYTSQWELRFCRKAWFRILSAAAFAALIALVWLKPHYFSVGALTLKRVYSGVTRFFYDLTELEFLGFTLLHYLVGFASFFFLMGISPTGNTFISHAGTYSVYIYVLHLFIIVLTRTLGKDHGFLDLFDTDLKALAYILAGIPLALFLASAPVRKATAWLVTPAFDLKKLISRLTKTG